MVGNVKEFCADPYQPDVYTGYLASARPETEMSVSGQPVFVVRGGSFASDAAELRIARRDQTRPDAWLLTDPQQPKSKWWYSDCNDVGFRIVCEYGGI